jgi:flagellar biosynthesis/type III secretory pathway protein FliH
MLAKAFDRKLRAKYMAEGKAEGKAEGEAETLSAVQEAAKRRGADLAEIQSVIEEARKIVRNGRP